MVSRSDCYWPALLIHIFPSATAAADACLLTSLAERQVCAAEREDISNLELP